MLYRCVAPALVFLVMHDALWIMRNQFLANNNQQYKDNIDFDEEEEEEEEGNASF